MFVLLRHLAQLRSGVNLPRGPAGSLALRHVDAGSCNGCEHELGALSNPYYDLQRFGLGVVASPRHADVLLVTGAVTRRMREPLLRAYAAMPEPRLVAAVGNCALGIGVLGLEAEAGGGVEGALGRVPIDITIPGCPPAPAVIADGLLKALEAKRYSGPSQPQRGTDSASGTVEPGGA